jgi:outer membrane protein OmpA-like peptidoglycan-associated protein
MLTKIFSVIIVISVFSWISAPEAFSQNALLAKAKDADKKGDKNLALELYLKALDKDPENSEINYEVGKLYLETIYRYKASPYLEKVYLKNPSYNKEINKYLAVAYQYHHLFDKAIEQYILCKANLPKDDSFLKSVDRRIIECKNGKEFVANPVKATIENLGPVINTSFAEYGPIVSAAENELIFTSRREGSTGGEQDEDGVFFEDIYISTTANGKWTKPHQIGEEINTPAHDASVGLSPDGRTLFIYKSDDNGDIFSCRMKRDSSWGEPVYLGGNVNTKKYYENAAAISADGKVFFFSSTKPGGFGELDIYMSIRDAKGNWGEAINLGNKINTEFDEEGPVLDLDGKTMYFSSMGHKCMGGFDIFKTIYDAQTNTWSEPINLGYPINSADDDVYFTLSGDGRHGYYASVKEGGYGEKDIYKITMPPREDYEQLVAKVNSIVKLSQLNSDKDILIASDADPKLKSSFESIKENPESMIKLNSDKNQNIADEDPKIKAEKEKLLEEEKIKMQKLKSDSLQAAKDADEKLKLQAKNASDEEKLKLKKLRSDSLQAAKDADEKLKLQTKNASDEEKLKLEKLRSDSLLLAQKDPKSGANLKNMSSDSRMRFQKLKEACYNLSRDIDAKLVARDKDLMDDEKTKLKNIKLSSLALTKEIDDMLSAGKIADEGTAKMKYERLKSDYDITIKTTDERLIAQQRKQEDESMHYRKLKSDSLKLAKLKESGLKSGYRNFSDEGFTYKGIIIKNIYFDLDKATLRPESISELEKIQKIMKDDSSVKLEINGHTCGLGSREYNHALSAKRTQSVVAWLTQHGVNSDRIVFGHHGEDKPIASNDFEKDGREFNRRVEFRVLE